MKASEGYHNKLNETMKTLNDLKKFLKISLHPTEKQAYYTFRQIVNTKKTCKQITLDINKDIKELETLKIKCKSIENECIKLIGDDE